MKLLLILFLLLTISCGTKKNDLESPIIPEYPYDAFWRKVTINNVATFKYPDATLEIQNNKIRKFVDSLKNELTIPAATSKFTLQQEGFNENENNEKYVRILWEKYEGAHGDFLESDIEPNELTESDQKMIKDYYKNDFETNLKLAGTEVISFDGVSLINHSGRFCIKISLTRKSKLNYGPVRVTTYCFPNSSHEYDFVFACRESERNKWDIAFDGIFKSFKFINNQNEQKPALSTKQVEYIPEKLPISISFPSLYKVESKLAGGKVKMETCEWRDSEKDSDISVFVRCVSVASPNSSVQMNEAEIIELENKNNSKNHIFQVKNSAFIDGDKTAIYDILEGQSILSKRYNVEQYVIHLPEGFFKIIVTYEYNNKEAKNTWLVIKNSIKKPT